MNKKKKREGHFHIPSTVKKGRGSRERQGKGENRFDGPSSPPSPRGKKETNRPSSTISAGRDHEKKKKKWEGEKDHQAEEHYPLSFGGCCRWKKKGKKLILLK